MQTGLSSTSTRVHFVSRIGAGLLLVLALLSPAKSFAFTVPAADYDGTFTITWDANPPSNSGGYTLLQQRFNSGSWSTIDGGGFGPESHTVTVSTSGSYDYKIDLYYMPPNPCQNIPPGGSCNPQMIGPGSSAIQTTVVALTAPASAPTLSGAGHQQ
jgi:hypothetical protein